MDRNRSASGWIPNCAQRTVSHPRVHSDVAMAWQRVCLAFRWILDGKSGELVRDNGKLLAIYARNELICSAKTNKKCGTEFVSKWFSRASCANVSHIRLQSTPNRPHRKLIAFCFCLIVSLRWMRSPKTPSSPLSSTQLIFAMKPTIHFFSASLASQLIQFNYVFSVRFSHLEVSHHFASRTIDQFGHNCIDGGIAKIWTTFCRSETSKLLIVLSFAPKKFSIQNHHSGMCACEWVSECFESHSLLGWNIQCI